MKKLTITKGDLWKAFIETRITHPAYGGNPVDDIWSELETLAEPPKGKDARVECVGVDCWDIYVPGCDHAINPTNYFNEDMAHMVCDALNDWVAQSRRIAFENGREVKGVVQA